MATYFDGKVVIRDPRTATIKMIAKNGEYFHVKNDDQREDQQGDQKVNR